jgi:hypothetical protein
MLTSELRANGDLDVATPNLGGDAMDVDEDGYAKDPAMTPVTQKLQLFVRQALRLSLSFIFLRGRSLFFASPFAAFLLISTSPCLH